MNRYSTPPGRPRTVALRAKGGKASAKERIENEEKAVLLAHRKKRETETKEAEVMVRNSDDEKEGGAEYGRTRSNPIVYEAMDHLRTYGYEPAPIRAPGIPLNIVAMKKSGSFFVLALRSRLPVPSAAKLRELFTKRVDRLCGMVERVKERIMIWVHSPACGWRYYLVYPGGLRYDHTFPASTE